MIPVGRYATGYGSSDATWRSTNAAWKLRPSLDRKVGDPLAQLRAELGTSKRTVQRDIGDLERAGFPVVSETRNGTIFWHFIEGFCV